VGSIYASNQAAKAQASAARGAAAEARAAGEKAADVQERMFNRQVELQEPFRQAGLTAQNRLLDYLALSEDKTAPGYGKYARDFGMADYTADPGYGFRMSEGMKALERSAAARGGLLSGSTLKGVQRFGQDLASEEYQNAFNRYQVNRANQLNPLQSLMGAGQTSTNVLTGAAGQTGQGVAGAQMGAGAARASGYTGMANALTSGLSTGANLYMQYPLYQAMGQYYSRPSYGQVSGANVGGPGGL
jgi:hypothetical protein